MASRGKSYKEMLTFYYAGVDVRKADGDRVRPPAQPVATSPERPKEEQDDRTTRRIGW